MKKNLFFCYYFFSFLFVSSQTYHSILLDHPEWHLTSCNNGCVTDIYSLSGDTVYNNQTYKVLDGFHYISKTFWLREEEAEKKVYMSYEMNFERKEVLLYDFSMLEGDTINISNPIAPFISNPGPFIVDSIEYIILDNGSSRKVMFLSSIAIVNENPVWIEGIGSLSLINAPGGTPNINGAGKLSCFFKNGSLIYSQLDSIVSCSSILGDINENKKTDKKRLIKKIDLLGKQSTKSNQLNFYIYDNGRVEKRISIKN